MSSADDPDPGSRPPARDEPRRRSALPDRYRYKPMGAAYQGALESVFSILIGAGLGYWVDRSWETSPVGLLVGATIGFAAFVLRLYRLGQAMNEPAPADSELEETSSGPSAERSEPSARREDDGSKRPGGRS